MRWRAGDFGREHPFLVGEREVHEGEFPNLGQGEGKEQPLIEAEFERTRQGKKDDELYRNDAQHQPGNQEWAAHNQPKINGRAYCNEEEAKQQPFERFDVAFQLMAIFACWPTPHRPGKSPARG